MGGYVSKKQNKNKRAFTLTELLIVVIVIGVLSAVTLPKFTRVIEN
ncbi:type IV pilin protein, partial [Candidatus Avelusimicrobium faecicola]